jgi:hypothetical protein
MTRTVTVLGLLAASTALAGGAVVQASAHPATGASISHQAARQAPTARLKLTPSSAALAACFPHAAADVKVALTTDEIGKDTFQIRASGLQPRTDFTVFLIEKAGFPFGAVEYFGDFTTNRYGSADGTFKLIVEEAFAFDNETQARTDLNSVGFWFADPKDDDGCLGDQSPVTQFDGDAEAGVQMMNSGAGLLP